LHSRTNFRHFYPLTELIGIFITAWAVALSYGLQGQFDINTLLLFLATLAYYALDHGLDARRFRTESFSHYLKLCMALCALSVLAFGVLLFQFGFMESLRSFMLRFYPTLATGLLYISLRTKTAIGFLILKSLLIALGVGFAISFPSLHVKTLIAPLLCWVNVLVFAYMERNKDVELGNANLFNNGFTKKSLLVGLVIVVITGIIMQWILSVNGGYGLSIYACLSIIIMVNEAKFRQNTYRWWLDALLPVTFLPLW
jgi:hypothetical protein